MTSLNPIIDIGAAVVAEQLAARRAEGAPMTTQAHTYKMDDALKVPAAERNSAPVCDECDLPMNEFSAPWGGSPHVWRCDGCGWSVDL